MSYLKAFEAALPWQDYLDTAPNDAPHWLETMQSISLTESQQELLSTFTRQIRILVVSGAWCGDCVRQGPVLQAMALATPQIELRFIDRDPPASPIDRLEINGGKRVPVVIFMSEDGATVSVVGDRTLSYYRWMAAQRLGPACPIPGAPVPADVLTAMTQDWVDECERVHLLLRLSPRLRQLHQD